MASVSNPSSQPAYPLQYDSDTCEPPRVVPVTFLFGSTSPAQSTWLFDYSVNQTLNFIQTLQGIYVDNSNNSQPVNISVVGSCQQLLIVPALSQAYLTILVSGPIKIQLTSSGTASVPVFFLNCPVNTHIWYPQSNGGTSNSYYGVAQASMSGSAIQLSTILPSGSPTTVSALTLQGAAANTSIIDVGSSSSVTVGTGLEIAAGAFKNYSNINTTLMYVIGGSGTKLNIEVLN